MAYPQPETPEATLLFVLTLLAGSLDDQQENTADCEGLTAEGKRGWDLGYHDAACTVGEVYRVLTGKEAPHLSDINPEIASDVSLAFALQAVS